MKTRLTALSLALLLLCGCGVSSTAESKDLTKSVTPQTVEQPAQYDADKTAAAVSDFSVSWDS